jgi:hypothetical protein
VQIAGPFKVKTEPYTITTAVAVGVPEKSGNWGAVLIVFLVIVIVVLLAGRRKEAGA